MSVIHNNNLTSDEMSTILTFFEQVKCAIHREESKWGAHLPSLGLEPTGG